MVGLEETDFDDNTTTYEKDGEGESKNFNDFKDEHAMGLDTNDAGINELKTKFESQYSDKCQIISKINRKPNAAIESKGVYKIQDECIKDKQAYVFLKPSEKEIEIQNLFIDTDGKNVDVVYVYTYDKDNKIKEIEIEGTLKAFNKKEENSVDLIFITFSKLTKDNGEVEGIEIEEDNGRKPRIEGWIVAPNTKVEIENDHLSDAPIKGGVISGSLEIELEKEHDESNLKIEGNLPNNREYLDDIVNKIVDINAGSNGNSNWSISYVE